MGVEKGVGIGFKGRIFGFQWFLLRVAGLLQGVALRRVFAGLLRGQ